MPRPKLALVTTGWLDGITLKQRVEIRFGSPDEDGYYADTLYEDWADRPQEEQRAEAEARYDRWQVAVHPTAPPPPETLEQHQQRIEGINQQIRDLVRDRMAAEEARAAAEANMPVAIAVQDGPWTTPASWQDGVMPEPGGRFVVPIGVTISDFPAGVAVSGTVLDQPDDAPPQV